MRYLENWKIGSRLALGFILVTLLAVGMAGLGAWRLQALRVSVEGFASDQLVTIDQLTTIKDNLNVMARAVRNVVLLTDPEAMKAEIRRITDARQANTALMKAAEPGLTEADERSGLAQLREADAKLATLMDRVVALGLQDQDAEATKILLGDVRPAQTAAFKAIDGLIDIQRKDIRSAVGGIADHARAGGLLMAALALLSALLGGLLAWVIQRSVVRPIRRAVAAAEAVAGGDLSQRIDSSARDETGDLLRAMQAMNQSLAHIVQQVRHASEQIAVGAGQVATGTADLSQRTEEQASNLEQTAASMEQLSGVVRHSADAARQANDRTQNSVALAHGGGAAIERMVGTMQAIDGTSRQVADIISVIDGIAFQTNILALNAAVEAARAGEQGRGFAVVAGEVRTLAQRAGTAAREIRTLIQGNVEQVEAGVLQAGGARADVQALVGAVEGIGSLLSQLSLASGEQSQGIGQINDAVAQLDHMTQQNAALVEQSAAAAESLSQQARGLAGLVQHFRLAPA